MVRRIGWLFAVLLAMRATVPLAAQGPAVGDVAPVVSVPDLDGKAVRLGVGAARHPVIIEFWATWCEVCRALLPTMRAAQKQYGDRVDFYGVNVTVNERKERVQQYVARNHPPFQTLYDERGAATRAFAAMATSYVVIIDRTGRVAYTGEGSDQKILAELAKVTAK